MLKNWLISQKVVEPKLSQPKPVDPKPNEPKIELLESSLLPNEEKALQDFHFNIVNEQKGEFTLTIEVEQLNKIFKSKLNRTPKSIGNLSKRLIITWNQQSNLISFKNEGTEPLERAAITFLQHFKLFNEGRVSFLLTPYHKRLLNYLLYNITTDSKYKIPRTQRNINYIINHIEMFQELHSEYFFQMRNIDPSTFQNEINTEHNEFLDLQYDLAVFLVEIFCTDFSFNPELENTKCSIQKLFTMNPKQNVIIPLSIISSIPVLFNCNPEEKIVRLSFFDITLPDGSIFTAEQARAQVEYAKESFYGRKYLVAHFEKVDPMGSHWERTNIVDEIEQSKFETIGGVVLRSEDEIYEETTQGINQVACKFDLYFLPHIMARSIKYNAFKEYVEANFKRIKLYHCIQCGKYFTEENGGGCVESIHTDVQIPFDDGEKEHMDVEVDPPRIYVRFKCCPDREWIKDDPQSGCCQIEKNHAYNKDEEIQSTFEFIEKEF